MSPSISNTIVLPSGETSKESHVPSSVVNSILRSLLSGSGFFSSFFSSFFSWDRALPAVPSNPSPKASATIHTNHPRPANLVAIIEFLLQFSILRNRNTSSGSWPTPAIGSTPCLPPLDAKREKASHNCATSTTTARFAARYTQPRAHARLSNYLDDRMFFLISTLRLQRRVPTALSLALCLFAALAISPSVRAQLIRLPSGQGEIVEI